MAGPRQAKALAALAFAASLLAFGGTALAKPGDIYVVANDGVDGIYKVGRAGGAATALATGTEFSDPFGVVISRRGKLLVADFDNGIVEVDPATGASTNFLPSAEVGSAADLALGADGFLYVTDFAGGPDPDGRVLRVNPRTKAVTEVFSGSPLEDPFGIAVTRKGVIYVADEQAGLIFKIAPGGAPVAFDGNPAVTNAEDFALSPDERFLYVTDFQGPGLVRMRRSDGATNTVAPIDSARGVALLPDRSFLVSDRDNDVVVRVPPSGSPVDPDFITNADWTFPAGILVEPPRCGGKLATIVGTKGRDVLKGSRFADVFAGLGGNDVLKGLKGKDRICGGKGRDRLIGGKGRDRLIGGPGRDRQRQ